MGTAHLQLCAAQCAKGALTVFEWGEEELLGVPPFLLILSVLWGVVDPHAILKTVAEFSIEQLQGKISFSFRFT